MNSNSGSQIESQMQASEGSDEHQSPQQERRHDGDGPVDTTRPNNVSARSHGTVSVPPIIWYTHAICTFGNGPRAQKILRPAPLFGYRQETVVGVLAAGFHPIDQKRRDSIDPRQERSVLGNDIAGRVLQNVDRPRSSNPLLEGATRIFGQSRKSFDSGSLQEVALLDLDYAARIPDCITDNEAATLPSLAFAAYYYLFHHTTLAFDPPCACDSHQTPQTPQTQKMVAIIGADNNLGRLAVQFASMANIQVIIAVGKIQSFEAMKAFGATHLLDVESLKTTDDIQAARSSIHTIAQGSSLCRIIDTTNWNVTLAASLLDTNTHGKIIGPFARYINYSKMPMRPDHSVTNSGRTYPKWLDSRKITPSKCEILPGGLNAEMVNEKLDAMGNSDGTDWSNFIVRPWDDGTLVETPLMRRFLKSGELPTRGN